MRRIAVIILSALLMVGCGKTNIFSIGAYELNVKTRGQGKVDRNVVGTKPMYEQGTTVELTATPDRHWKFSHWEGAVDGTEDRGRQVQMINT